MKILILGLNYYPEPTGIAIYSAGLAAGLRDRGHEIEVVTGYPYYPEWKIKDGYFARWYKVTSLHGIPIVRCPLYVPANPTMVRRIIHHLSFAFSSLIPMMLRSRKMRPDIILSIAPSILSAPVANLAAKFWGGKTWLHVQDFEVEASFATGHLSAGSRLGKLAMWFERKILGNFDQTSTISREMCKKMLTKLPENSNVIELCNWAEIDSIQPQDYSIFREKWKIDTRYVALYSGSIAKKQGIALIVDVARILRDRDDITFIICGNGPEKDELERLAQDQPNVRIYELQPREDLNELLNLATIHLLPQKADAADLVLPSKLANMLASGRPVVVGAHEGTGLAREIKGCGVRCEPENPQSMANAIELLVSEPEIYKQYSIAARKQAMLRWHRQALIDMFESSFSSAVQPNRATTDKTPINQHETTFR